MAPTVVSLTPRGQSFEPRACDLGEMYMYWWILTGASNNRESLYADTYIDHGELSVKGESKKKRNI